MAGLHTVIGSLERAAQIESWPGGKLPSVRTLAEQYGTSPVTVLRALKDMAARGIVETLPGRQGYFIKGRHVPPATVSRPSAPKYRYLGIAEKIKALLISESQGTDDDPFTLKDLKARFSCSYATARSSLEALVEQGFIEKRGRGYVSREPAGHERGRSHVYLVGPADTLDDFNARYQPSIKGMENEMERLGWGHLKFVFAHRPEEAEHELPDHTVAAFVHVHYFKSHHWIGFLQRRAPVPVAAIDTLEETWDPLCEHPNHVRIVPDNAGAGREVARHLSALGHRHIAFFSHFPLSYEWAKRRLAGIQSVYPVGKPRDGRRMWLFDGSRMKHVHDKGLERAYGMMDKIRKAARESRMMSSPMAVEGIEPMYRLLSLWQYGRNIIPLFEEALSRRRLTAWVCINDEMASLAHSWLVKRGLRPGRDIAIVGFDNEPIACKLGITSYDLNLEKMGHAAIRGLAEPGLLPGRSNGTVVIEGRLQVRESTDRAGK